MSECIARKANGAPPEKSSSERFALVVHNLPPEESSSERFMHHPMTRKEQAKKKTELPPIFCLRFCSKIDSENHMPNEFSMR